MRLQIREHRVIYTNLQPIAGSDWTDCEILDDLEVCWRIGFGAQGETVADPELSHRTGVYFFFVFLKKFSLWDQSTLFPKNVPFSNKIDLLPSWIRLW